MSIIHCIVLSLATKRSLSDAECLPCQNSEDNSSGVEKDRGEKTKYFIINRQSMRWLVAGGHSLNY